MQIPEFHHSKHSQHIQLHWVTSFEIRLNCFMYKDWKGEKEVICHSIWQWRQQVGVHSSTLPSFHLFGPSSLSSNRWKNTMYVQTGQGSLDATAETLFVMSPWKVNSFIWMWTNQTQDLTFMIARLRVRLCHRIGFCFKSPGLPKAVSRTRQNLN